MLTKPHQFQSSRPGLSGFMADLAETVTRNMMVAFSVLTGLVGILWVLGRSGDVPLILIPGAFIAGCLTVLAVRLVARNRFLAQTLWLLAVVGLGGLAFFVLKAPEISLFFALLPLLFGWMAGWPAGLAVLIATTGVNGFFHLNGMLPMNYLITSAVIKIFLISLGWAFTSPVFALLEWSVVQYHTARVDLEEARDQRVELKQIQQDLIHSNNELSRMSIQMKILSEKAEEARRAKEEFVANVSHELRTPLNMIVGYADLIIKSPKTYGKNLSSRLLADITAVQRNSEHLIDLINDVLDLSQVDAGRMALTRRWESIANIVEEAVAAIRPLFESKNLYLRQELPTARIMVYCDATRIREVLLNLLSNAGRYTDQGGVVIKAWEVGSQLHCSVSDTGRGIPPEDRLRIFEPFQQVDPILHHQTGGSGLGLTISKRFIEMHGGKMWLESEVGAGTTFFFSLPLEYHEIDSEPGAKTVRWINPYQEYIPRAHRNKAPLPETTPRFIIVEEERTLERLFQRYNHQVSLVSVDTLAAAADEFRREPAQLIVLNTPASLEDNNLAEIGQFPVPVIRCWLPGREEVARRLGVVRYLLKPIPQQALLAAIDETALPAQAKILLVDDDPDTLHLYSRVLPAARPGYRVMRASNGKQALQFMRERQPDLVLLDLIMPEVDGFAVLRAKSEDALIRSIPVIVITSNDPAGQPILSNHIEIQQTHGFTVREFLDCINGLHQILNTPGHKLDRAPKETNPVSPA